MIFEEALDDIRLRWENVKEITPEGVGYLIKTAEQLQVALETLADIGLSTDMTESERRLKAQRIYREIRSALKQ